jgi:WS/DGAT/MGAT family acyltransferase
MASQLNHRLSAHDAGFLYLERRAAPLHIGSLGTYEGTISFDRFVEHIDSRLPSIPRYRQRLCFVPFSLAHPTWEDDPEFDIRKHIFRVDLPSPGTEEQLRELSTRLFQEPLDREKPLWEMYVVHGLEGDKTAIVSKVHHCMVDGVSGIQLLLAVVDITPEPAPPPGAEPYQPKPLPPTGARLADAFWDGILEQRNLWNEVQRDIAQPTRPLRQAQTLARAMSTMAPWMFRPAPRLPFTGASLQQNRRVAFSDMSFVEIREIRTSLGGTVNDVVLAILAGAFRRYLAKHGFDINAIEPRVAIPVNVRLEDEQGALGNKVSAMFAALPIGEPDPAQRLARMQERMNALKSDNQAGAIERLLNSTSLVPVPVQVLAAATMSNTMVNFICTNVPGPMIPLYSVGHLLLEHYPLVPLSLDMGFGVGVTSYNQRLFFGMMAEPRAMPDVDDFKRFVDESFLELRAAAGVAPTDIPAFAGRTNGQTKRVPTEEVALAER